MGFAAFLPAPSNLDAGTMALAVQQCRMRCYLTNKWPTIRVDLEAHGILIQLDWPWVAEWAYASIFTVAVQIQNQDQFWISHQKIRGRFLIFSKSKKKELVRKKTMFLAISAKIRSFSGNSDM